MEQRKPKPIRCPTCQHLEETIVCRYCRTDKLSAILKRPAEVREAFEKLRLTDD